jgi:hypothetical protein
MLVDPRSLDFRLYLVLDLDMPLERDHSRFLLAFYDEEPAHGPPAKAAFQPGLLVRQPIGPS